MSEQPNLQSEEIVYFKYLFMYIVNTHAVKMNTICIIDAIITHILLYYNVIISTSSLGNRSYIYEFNTRLAEQIF